jgi:myo-inositol-1(or 4)-monophosphatase
MASTSSYNRSLGDLASFARELALIARHETLSRFTRACAVENKGVQGQYDPVTEADRAAETVMRDLIGATFPDHGIRGEEFADKQHSGAYTWSLDPIDGTRSFMCGLPTWTTLIALLEDDEPVIGLIDAPRLEETYVGFDDAVILVRKAEEIPIRTSGCIRMEEARFSTTDPFLFGGATHALQRVLRQVRVSRFGHDGYAYARLAAGNIDLVIESGLKPHDYHALIPVVRAAGGHIGDWSGGNDFAAGNVIAAASRELYGAAVELLANT